MGGQKGQKGINTRKVYRLKRKVYRTGEISRIKRIKCLKSTEMYKNQRKVS